MPIDRTILEEQIRITQLLLIENRLEFLKTKFLSALSGTAIQKNLTPEDNDLIKAYAGQHGWLPDAASGEASMFIRVEKNGAYMGFYFKPEVLFNYISSFDPSRSKAYTQWLLTMVTKNGLRFEDLGKASETLTIFDKVKPRMPADQRDVLKYKDLPTLHSAAEAYAPKLSQAEIDREYEREMFSQAIVRLNTPEYRIVTPKTMEAAQFFGRNTRWCTSAQNSNMFDSYNRRGPLYIILHKPTNTRWQYHPAGGEFRDERDVGVDVTKFCNEHPVIKDYFENELIHEYDWVERFGNHTFGWMEETLTLSVLTGMGMQMRSYMTFVFEKNQSGLSVSSIRYSSYSDNVLRWHNPMPGLVDALNKVGAVGPTPEEFVNAGIAYLPKLKKWGMVSEGATTLVKNNLFEQWKKFTGDVVRTSEYGNKSTEKITLFLHLEADGSVDWVLERDGAEIKTVHLEMSAKSSETRNKKQATSRNYVDQNGDIVRRNPEYQTSTEHLYNDAAVVERHLAICFAELSPFIPKGVAYTVEYGSSDSFNPLDAMPDELTELLVKKRPNLVRPKDIFKLKGDSKATRNAITRFIDQTDNYPKKYSWTPEGLVISGYNNAADMIEDIGSDHAKWIMSVMDGSEYLDVDDSPSLDNLRDFIDNLDEDHRTAVGLYLLDSYPDDIDDEIEDYDPSDVDHIIEIQELVEDSSLASAANYAYRDGARNGQEGEMYKSLMSSLSELNYVWYNQEGKQNHTRKDVNSNWKSYDPKVKYLKEGDVWIVIPVKEIIKYMNNPDDWGAVADDYEKTFDIKLDMHSTDYWGYDEDSANESFAEKIVDEGVIDDELLARAKTFKLEA